MILSNLGSEKCDVKPIVSQETWHGLPRSLGMKHGCQRMKQVQGRPNNG